MHHGVSRVCPTTSSRRTALIFRRALTFPPALHFSDTSGANKSSHGTTQDQYDEGVKKVFTAGTVPSLAGQLKAYKKMVRPKRFKPTDGDSMGLARAGQNLHFFREGVSPTWEDGWNAKVRTFRVCSAHADADLVGHAYLTRTGRTSDYLAPLGTLRGVL